MSAPIPPVLWQRIVAFLATKPTGKVVLNVKCGEIRSYELIETGDARTPILWPLDKTTIDVKPCGS